MLIGYVNMEFREEGEPEDTNLEFIGIRMVSYLEPWDWL